MVLSPDSEQEDINFYCEPTFNEISIVNRSHSHPSFQSQSTSYVVLFFLHRAHLIRFQIQNLVRY